MRCRKTGSVTRVAVFLAALVAIVFSWVAQAAEAGRNDFQISAMGPSLARSSAATGLTKPTELVQFTSAGHVLGFAAGGMIAATGSHAVRVEFVDANAVSPQTAAASEKPAVPLTSVTYPGLWDGVTLTYDASGIARSTYRLEPYAGPGAGRRLVADCV